MTHPAALAAIGLAIGLVGSAVGVGGGFFMVPYLLLAAHFTHIDAVTTSLAVIFASGLVAVAFFAAQRRIDYTTGLAFAVSTVPGAVGGAYVTRLVDPGAFTLAFAGLLVFAAVMLVALPRGEADRVRTARSGFLILPRTYTSLDGRTIEYSIDLRLGIVVSLVTGFVSSFFGVGGGLLHVPCMVLLLGMPFRIAAPTSTFILPFTVAVGFASLWQSGVRVGDAALWLGAGAVAGAALGAWGTARVRGTTLRYLLAGILILVGLRLVLGYFGVLSDR